MCLLTDAITIILFSTMKVLTINAFNYRKGGSETVMFNIGELLREHGHEVVHFALKWPENLPDGNSAYFPESKETRSGRLRSVKNVVNYFYHFEAARKLDALIEKERPDIAQIHLIWGQLTPSVLRVLRRRGIPAVLTVHDYRLICPAYVLRDGSGRVCEQCRGHRFYKCVTNTCCRGSKGLSAMMAAEQYFRNAFFAPDKYLSGLLYVSDFARNIHLRYMPGLADLPSARIYNFSKAIDPELSEKPDKRYYLYFGRLSAEKGVETLIKTFAGRPHLRLKLVGIGPEEERLRAFAAEHGVSNIEFVGYRAGKALEDLVRGAYFVVVPSEWYENNPLTIIEAYSAATPVIGSSIGGIPEIVDDGVTGFRFDCGNPASLGSAVDKAEALDADAYEAMRRSALDFARDNFDREAYYASLIDFFGRVIAERKSK